MLGEGHAERAAFHVAVELDDADGPVGAHVDDAGRGAAGLQPGGQGGVDARDVGLPLAGLEEVEAGVGGGAGQRVGHVGRAVHQGRAGVVGPERLEHPAAGDGRRERQGAAGQRLGEGDDVGRHARAGTGEQVAGAAEADEDLIEDQQQVVLVGQPAQGAQHFVGMEQHAARALDARLDDDRGDLAGLLAHQGVERRFRGGVDRQGGDDLRRHHPGKQAVHAFFRIADGHRRQGVAVIAALERQEPGAAGDAAVDPVLQRHLHGDLDRHRAAFGEEHVVQVAGQQACKPGGQPIGRLVRQAAEHHVRRALQLCGHRRADVRVIVAVTGGPPGGDAVDKFAPVLQDDPRAFGAGHRQRRGRGLHLTIGTPDVAGALGKPVRCRESHEPWL